MQSKTPPTEGSIQQWGNSLAVRIPVAIARKLALKRGQSIVLSVQGPEIVLARAAPRQLTLAEKLATFDSEIHDGEAMPSRRRGREAI